MHHNHRCNLMYERRVRRVILIDVKNYYLAW